jgi:hypothetical protein
MAAAKTHLRKLAGWWSQLPLPRRMKPPDTPHHLSVKTKTPTIVREEITAPESAANTYTGISRDTCIITKKHGCRQSGFRGRGREGQQPQERKTHFARMSDVPQKEERLRFVSTVPC